MDSEWQRASGWALHQGVGGGVGEGAGAARLDNVRCEFEGAKHIYVQF